MAKKAAWILVLLIALLAISASVALAASMVPQAHTARLSVGGEFNKALSTRTVARTGVNPLQAQVHGACRFDEHDTASSPAY